MKLERKRLLFKTSTLLGSIVILLPNGLAMYWGNMSVYTNSYIVVYLQYTYGVEAPWTASLFMMFWTLGIMVYSFVRKLFGKHWTIILGCVVTDVGMFVSHFSLQTSFVLLNLTFPVLIGIGTGLLHAAMLSLLVDWANQDMACLISTMQGSFYWGAMIINQLVTLYVNPSNATPDILIGSSTYFTQKKIIDRVPSLFLLLGGFSVASHVVGFSLLRENSFDKLTDETKNQSQKEVSPVDGGYNIDGTNRQSQVPTSTNLNRRNSHRSAYGSVQEAKQNGSPPVSTKGRDYSPKEVLKSAMFYILWISFFFAEYPFLLMGNYYKSFGQIWIHDDYFLAALGTSLSFINIWIRVFWGILMDKIGVRICLVFQILFVTVLTVWFYFTPILNKWVYFVATNLFSAVSGVLFGSMSVVIVAIFGKTHFSINFGLLRSSCVILSILCPFVTEAILKNFGWFYMFFVAGFLNTISLILMLFFLPAI